MPSSKLPKTRRKLTVELIDELLAVYHLEENGINDPRWDEFMDALWGKRNEEGVLLDLLILARVALEHINVVIVHGGPKDVPKAPPGMVQTPHMGPLRPLGPEQEKVAALKLPMKTIGDFLGWLGRRYPYVRLVEVDTKLALYEYFNIDPQALAEEEKQQAK